MAAVGRGRLLGGAASQCGKPFVSVKLATKLAVLTEGGRAGPQQNWWRRVLCDLEERVIRARWLCVDTHTLLQASSCPLTRNR